MNSITASVVISLLAGACFAADAEQQARPGVAAPAGPNHSVVSEEDYALTLRDPFSPVGYRLPVLEHHAPAASMPAVSNVPPPSIDLKAKAKAMLRVSGIVKQGNKYVANLNGVIVHAGDEIGVTVDAQTVMFVIRSISLKQVQIEPRE